MKKTSATLPPLVETSYNTYRQKIQTVNFDISYPEEVGGEYVYEALEVPPGRFNYHDLVSLLIRHRYQQDEMEAVINNYLRDPMEAAPRNEFEAMQLWRETAKQIARKALAAATT